VEDCCFVLLPHTLQDIKRGVELFIEEEDEEDEEDKDEEDECVCDCVCD